MKHYVLAIACWLRGYSIAIIIIAAMAWGYFAVFAPIVTHTKAVKEVVAMRDTFEVWVESITNMETNYDKILKEGSD